MIEGLQTIWAQVRPRQRATRRSMMLLFAVGTLGEQSLVIFLSRALSQYSAFGHEVSGAPLFALGVVIWIWCDRTLIHQMIDRCGQAAIDQTFDLVDIIRRAPLGRLEAVGAETMIHAITNDAQSLAGAGASFVLSCRALTRILGGLLYSLTISLDGAGAASAVLVAVWAAGSNQIEEFLGGVVHTFQSAARLRGLLNQMVDGHAAIRQHDGRRRGLGMAWEEAVDALRQIRLEVFGRYYQDNDNINALTLVLFALLAFALPALSGQPAGELRALSTVILWMTIGVYGAIYDLPPVNEAVAALRRQEALKARLVAPSLEDRTAAPGPFLPGGRLDHIAARGLVYVHRSDQGRNPFPVGPVEVVLRAGEVVMLTGLNGSGKSTFTKTLIGLYVPSAGHIEVNGVPVPSSARDQLRELFGYIPAETHIFDAVHGLTPEQLAQAPALMERLEIANHTAIVEGRITNQALSSGQRQRLALALTLLQDRPALVFDEWAATQDPEHRAYFYDQVLPELRAQGKIVIVVSHDDRYFHLADRRLVFVEGQMTELERGGTCA